jgi:hypothetical protein
MSSLWKIAISSLLWHVPRNPTQAGISGPAKGRSIAYIAAIAVAVMLGASVAAAQGNCYFSLDDVPGRVPKFEDFTVPVEAKGTPAPVVLSSAEARLYRTVLRRGAAKGPNFADHYTIVAWGCGTSCTDWAIVDAKSGRITFFDDLRAISGAHLGPEKSGLPEYWGLRFRRDSKLLIIVGAPKEDEGREGIAYYEWNENSLDRLDFISRERLCSRAK